jgi:hypothetical protein
MTNGAMTLRVLYAAATLAMVASPCCAADKPAGKAKPAAKAKSVRAGAVGAFDIPLSPSAREEAQERARIATIPLEWQAIPDHPEYPSDDVIVAALTVTDPRLEPPLPKDTAGHDCTATFQAAIDQVWAQGGGTVFAPAGQYRVDGPLVVRQRVTLRGHWSRPAQNDWKTGTVLLAALGKEGGDALVTLRQWASIKGLTFWYPNQPPDAPVPCPPTVAGGGAATIEDVSFVNAWEALSIPQAAMLLLRGVHGTAIHRGLLAGAGVALPRFEALHLSPDFWTWWPLGEARATADRTKAGSYAHHMWQKGVGFSLREMDGCTLVHGSISGYAEGIVLEDNDGAAESDDGAPHGQAIRTVVRDCRTALRVRIGRMEWTQCEFGGTESGIRSSEKGSVNLLECSVSGGTASVLAEPASRLAVRCSLTQFSGPIDLRGDNVIHATRCSFSGSGPHVLAGPQATGELLGSTADRAVAVAKAAGITVRSAAPDLERLPPFGVDRDKDWARRRRPAKADVFNVRDRRFAGGAQGDGSHDDSQAVRAALDAARANGGGIVFFPSGYYRVRGTFDAGDGVEFRGAAGARHAAGTGAVEATDQLLSVLVIEPNPGGLDGAPLLSLGDGSGVRGLSFFYPHRNWKRLLDDREEFDPLPFTIIARGRGAYVIDSTAPNPDQFVHFRGAKEFLVEGCLLGGTRTVFRVGEGAESGRIQNCHVKPSGFWGGLTDVPNTSDRRGLYGEETAKQLVVFDLEDCTDITLTGVFGRTAHRLFSAHGAAGRALLIGGEELQNGYIFDREAPEPFHLLACEANLGMHGDGTGKHSLLLQPRFRGTVHAFAGCDMGTADYVARVLGGSLITQDRGTSTAGYRAPRGVHVAGGCRMTVLDGGFGREWTQTIEPGGMLAAAVGPPPLVSAPGQFQFGEHGLRLDRTGTERHREKLSWSQRLTAGDSFRVDVNDPLFSGGKQKPVDVTVGLYSDRPCTVSLFYDGPAGEKLARTVNVGAKDKDFHLLRFKMRDARFAARDGTDLRIAVGEAAAVAPRLSFVCLAVP